MAGPVRQPFDQKSFQQYIEKNVPAIKCPLDVKQFGYGQSNPTYLLTDATGHNYVMRKKPPGKLLSKSAHRVDREYRILHSLEDTDVAVPKTYCLCEDDSVIGTPFYIMEFCKGRIFHDPAIPEVDPAARYAMWRDAIQTLGRFHRVDPTSVKMQDFGKHSGFYDRQINLFGSLCVAQAETKDIETGEQVGKIPYFDEIMTFFKQKSTQPKDRGTFVHGDYKIDNLIFHPTEPRVIGILDWEMSTIGHPLADITNLLTPYVTANNRLSRRMREDMTGVGSVNNAFVPGALEGLPTKEQCLAWYAETAGWNPSDSMSWGEAFNVFKGAVIVQGIAARHAMRQASSEKASEYAASMGPMGWVAYDLVQQAEEDAKGGKSKL